MLPLFGKIFRVREGIISCKSEKGLKNNQEDSYYISPVINGRRLIIVADGVGGHGNGDFASDLCINVFSDEFQKNDCGFIPVDFLEQTSIQVAEKILQKSKEDASFKNCGTTVSGFLIVNDEFYTLNIGDSRSYLFRDGKLFQLTQDHSLVRKLLEEGHITETEARNHPKRHIMTSAIGQPLEQMTISIEGPKKRLKKDLFLTCTDGVHEFISYEEITRLIIGSPPENIADNIVDYALRSGSTDNITCCCIKF